MNVHSVERSGRRTAQFGSSDVALRSIGRATQGAKSVMGHAVAIGLLGLLISCGSAVRTPEVKEPMSGPPAPTFRGTWTTKSHVWRDDEVVGMATSLLTFTKSRYIQHTLIEEFDGTLIDDKVESGTWSSTDTMVTRTWVRRDQNDTWQTQSVAKNYVWTEDGSVLFMEPWGDGQESDKFARYTRVDIPEPFPLAGSWRRVWSSQTNSRVLTQTFIFNDDMFTFIEHDTNDDDQPATVGTLTGTWSTDHDERFILVSVESASGGNRAFGAQRFREGQILRLAYAPTTTLEKVRFSPYWREQRFDSSQNAWVDEDREDRRDRKYGNYTFLFTREDANVPEN